MDGGTKYDITPPMLMPMASHTAISPSRSTKAYSIEWANLLMNECLFSCSFSSQNTHFSSFGGAGAFSFFPNRFSDMPAVTAVIKAAKGLKTVIKGSRRAYVRKIESTPVSGVDIKNESVAPFEAPLLRNDIAVGKTPHEHNGNGMPKRAARNTDLNPGLPRCFTTFSLSKKICMNPAIKVPKSIYGAAETKVIQISLSKPIIISIDLPASAASSTTAPTTTAASAASAARTGSCRRGGYRGRKRAAHRRGKRRHICGIKRQPGIPDRRVPLPVHAGP